VTRSGHGDDAGAVRDFVRTPLTVRHNVVKVWRPLPTSIWIALNDPSDHRRGKRCERQALIGVGLMATLLLAGFSGLGLQRDVEGEGVCVPLIGRSTTPVSGAQPSSGFCYVPGESLTLVSWTVVPSLAGWVCLRFFWIPVVARGRGTREATLTFARHLGSVYLYVYITITLGALMMPLLILAAPRATAFLRWCLWCVLFGESFFVPAVMWLRLIARDRAGEVFGRRRYLGLVVYLLLLVVGPIAGMVTELDVRDRPSPLVPATPRVMEPAGVPHDS